MAWETLDAILLTSEEWQNLPIALRRGLFAEGITLAVTAGPQPDAILPWRHSDQWWIASSESKLPPMIDGDVYSLADEMTIGRSEAFRRRILLFGAIYCLTACGACLWRSRWMPAGFIAMSITAGLVFAFDNNRQSPIFQRSGIVRLTDGMTLEDHWVYQVSHRPADFSLPVAGFVHPIFSDQSQIESLKLNLDCGGDGEPIAINGHLPADGPLVLMSRRVAAGGVENSTMSRATSPLLKLERSVYPQFQFDGQFTDSTEEDIGPKIVLSRR